MSELNINEFIKVTTLTFNNVIYPIIRPSCELPYWENDKRTFKKNRRILAIELNSFAYVKKEIIDKIKSKNSM